MDSKSIFMSKTLWTNLLAPFFLWLAAKGLPLTPDQQATLILWAMAVVNVLLRLVTKQPVHVVAPPAVILFLVLIGSSVFLVACTGQEIVAGSTAVQLACADAQAAGSQAQAQLKGGAANTATEIVNDYVAPACGTADAIAKIAGDPTTAAWLGGLTQQLKGLVSG